MSQQVKMKIVPVEVKAGKSGTLKSLQQIAANKNISLCIRFDLKPPTIQEFTYTLLSLPIYLVGELPRILDEIRIA